VGHHPSSSAVKSDAMSAGGPKRWVKKSLKLAEVHRADPWCLNFVAAAAVSAFCRFFRSMTTEAGTNQSTLIGCGNHGSAPDTLDTSTHWRQVPFTVVVASARPALSARR